MLTDFLLNRRKDRRAACRCYRSHLPSGVLRLAVAAGLLLLPLLIGGDAAADDDRVVRGLLEPTREATISSEINARIVRFPFEAGDSFRKNATLAQFDCSLPRAQLDKALAERNAAYAKLQSNKRLAALKSIGALEVNLARAEHQAAKAEVKHRRILVSRCVIKAPFAGRVSEVLVNAHEMVEIATPLLGILDDSSLKIRLIVPSNWLGWLRHKASFSLIIDETGQTFAAEVEKIGARIDPVSQTIPVIGHFTKPDRSLVAGMTGTARF